MNIDMRAIGLGIKDSLCSKRKWTIFKRRETFDAVKGIDGRFLVVETKQYSFPTLGMNVEDNLSDLVTFPKHGKKGTDESEQRWIGIPWSFCHFWWSYFLWMRVNALFLL